MNEKSNVTPSPYQRGETDGKFATKTALCIFGIFTVMEYLTAELSALKVIGYALFCCILCIAQLALAKFADMRRRAKRSIHWFETGLIFAAAGTLLFIGKRWLDSDLVPDRIPAYLIIYLVGGFIIGALMPRFLDKE